jgi:outer membrane immunogenic protein
MRFDKTALLATLLALSAPLAAPLAAQMRASDTFGTDPGQTPVLEVSGGYTYLHANAPPALCGCFSANGGYGSVVFNMPRGFGVVADLSIVRSHGISGTTQSITLFNYLFGPRYSMRNLSSRIVPYVQALGGGSMESSNYVAVQNVSGAAFSVGGGVTATVSPHVGFTIIEADWVGSRVPNGSNNVQNDLRVSTGLNFRLGPR